MAEDTSKREKSAGSLKSTAVPSLMKQGSVSKVGVSRDRDGDELYLEPREQGEQLHLTESELEEFYGRSLGIMNPQYVENAVVYSYRESKFIPFLESKTETVLFCMDGSCIHVDSPEAIKQRELEALGEEIIVPPPPPPTKKEKEEEDKSSEEEEEEVREEAKPEVEPELGEADVAKGEGDEDDEPTVSQEKIEDDFLPLLTEREKDDTVPTITVIYKKTIKKLINKFNYSDRAALTFNVPPRNSSSQTFPPPTANFNSLATQWIIYDTYQEDYKRLEKEKELERQAKLVMQMRKEEPAAKKTEEDEEEQLETRKAHCAKILERMINQNIFDEVALDCQYYDDPADKYRKNEGCMLPLWHFTYCEADNMAVTDIVWNPYYHDLFGASFGMLDFQAPDKKGLFCLFSLKNPSFPEYAALMDTGVMSLDFHQTKPYLLACGLHNGAVAIFNINEKEERPTHVTSVDHMHKGIVWQVHWGDDPRERLPTCYSASSDGQILKWSIMGTELVKSLVITLFLDAEPLQGPYGIEIKMKAEAMCFSFHPKNKDVFLVGTFEGLVYKCSLAYASSFMFTYKAHSLPVNRVCHNNYSPEIFASCSSDWRVKIWEDQKSEPLYIFNLESPVADVEWAPYSSTIFAAVTSDGNIQVYDLNLNKYDAVCLQVIICTQDNALTRIRFNQKIPIIIAGDIKGTITSAKLSPNLRIKPKPPKKQQNLDNKVLEVMKLEKVLSYVREPVFQGPETDTETVAS